MVSETPGAEDPENEKAAGHVHANLSTKDSTPYLSFLGQDSAPTQQQLTLPFDLAEGWTTI